MENNLKVTLWGREVGRLFWDTARRRAVFSYSDSFLKSGIDIAPLTASIHSATSKIPIVGLKNDEIFNGLPAFLSDSLPGRWGNTVFSAWAQEHEISERNLTPVDKLSFMGRRCMGALEFEPAHPIGSNNDLRIDDLYRKALEILEAREEIVIRGEDIALNTLYEVGTSAGGQHTKAIIARNVRTGEIRSGQVQLPPDYRYYILKFAESDRFPMPEVEYVYSLMARDAGIRMMPCELIEAGGRRHFMTERFDRVDGLKIHTQTLAAMKPDATSYEDLMDVCIRLGLPVGELEQMYRLTVFNILATNVDAHIRNFSFMLQEGGEWHITPAYDVTFSCYIGDNRFDPDHYLRLRGKTHGISYDDMVSFGKYYGIKNPGNIIAEVKEAVKGFRSHAVANGIPEYWIDKIEGHFVEMNPEILKDVTAYRPNVFLFTLDDGRTLVKDAQWTEMGNGAMRLTAEINGVPHRATFPPKSPKTREILASGGAKMSADDMLRYIREYLLKQ